MTKKTLRSILAIGALLCFLAAFVVPQLFKPDQPSVTRANDYRNNEPQFQHHADLTFWKQSTGDSLTSIEIEIAEQPEKRTLGLMYRRSMPENRGMLFLFDRMDDLSFWMKNTYIPLDIIFLDNNRKIVTIHRNTTPLVEEHYLSYDKAQYVVEVNAHFCSAHNIEEGDSISWQQPPL